MLSVPMTPAKPRASDIIDLFFVPVGPIRIDTGSYWQYWHYWLQQCWWWHLSHQDSDIITYSRLQPQDCNIQFWSSPQHPCTIYMYHVQGEYVQGIRWNILIESIYKISYYPSLHPSYLLGMGNNRQEDKYKLNLGWMVSDSWN